MVGGCEEFEEVAPVLGGSEEVEEMPPPPVLVADWESGRKFHILELNYVASLLWQHQLSPTVQHHMLHTYCTYMYI